MNEAKRVGHTGDAGQRWHSYSVIVVKAACLESQRSRVRPPLWQSGLKETQVSFPLTHKDSALWKGSMTDR